MPGHEQGTSLLPLVNGQTRETRGEIFAEVNYHACYEPQRCIRTRRFKYIRRFDQRQHPVLPNSDDSLTKDLLMDRGWRQRTLEPEQLKDLVFDPHETRNLAADPDCQDHLRELRKRLDQWMQDTGDPLCQGAP